MKLGGQSVDVSINSLVNIINSMAAKIELLEERTSSTGVTFNKMMFASQSEFTRWYTDQNPTGDGLSAFVDVVSIWSFISDNQGTTSEWLATLRSTRSIGFEGNTDSSYAHSMTTKYPSVFVGNAQKILSTNTIEVFKEVDLWKGNGAGDGNKEQLVKSVGQASDSHATYCDDNLRPGELKDMAVKTGTTTAIFLRALVSYLEDERNLLTSYKLQAKDIMLLLSNQVVQIFDDIFDQRTHGKMMSVDNKVAMGARFAWVTLRTGSVSIKPSTARISASSREIWLVSRLLAWRHSSKTWRRNSRNWRRSKHLLVQSWLMRSWMRR